MRKKILAGFFFIFALMTGAAFAEGSEVFTLSAYGEGEVSASPDTASVVLSVKTQAGDAKAAQENNAKIANRVAAAIKACGIDGGDIKTSRFSIYPIYDNNTRKINGYAADNSVTVKIKNIGKVGETIDGALSAGANQVSSIRFGISDARNLEKEALVLAVRNAREQAEVAAKALGVSIVGIKHASPNVRRQSFDTSPMLMKSTARAENLATPIEGGEVSVHASVNVEFVIK